MMQKDDSVWRSRESWASGEDDPILGILGGPESENRAPGRNGCEPALPPTYSSRIVTVRTSPSRGFTLSEG